MKEQFGGLIRTNSSTWNKITNKDQYKNSIVFIEDIKQIYSNGIYYISSLSPDLIVNITYSELKTLRDSSKLLPGVKYRITDYVTTVNSNLDPEARSANHPFDIIVEALTGNTLSENASAIQHEGDTYFQNSLLKSWKLQYCLDNDNSRFQWADAVNGKGVIYRMIDENDNDISYDFKNVQFKRYKITESEKYPGLVNSYKGIKNNPHYSVDENEYIWCYTFNWFRDESDFEVEDLSTYPKSDDAGVISLVCNNKYLPYTFSNCRILNNGVNCCTESFESGCFYGIWNTITKNDCSSWTCGDYCSAWTCEKYCSSWACGDYCSAWTCGVGCDSWICGDDCSSWTCGVGCSAWTCGNGCYSWTCGDSCFAWTCGDSCFAWTCGDGCYSWTCGVGCYLWTCGDDCSSWTCGDYCSGWTCGVGCSDWTCGVGCYLWTCGNGCYSWTCGSEYINFNILNNTCNVNIEVDSYDNKLIKNTSYCQYIGFDSKDNLRIWIPADSSTKLVSLLLSELQDLKHLNQLEPGQKYKIIDYKTTIDSNIGTVVYNDEEAHYIIVEALDKSNLNSDAKSISIYTNTEPTEDFELIPCKCNIKFDLDESSIYWMKDNYGNEAPYDFKHIKFNNCYTFGTESEDYSIDGFNNGVYNNIIMKPLSSQYNRICISSKNTYGNTFYPSCTDCNIDFSIKESLISKSEGGLHIFNPKEFITPISVNSI